MSFTDSLMAEKKFFLIFSLFISSLLLAGEKVNFTVYPVTATGSPDIWKLHPMEERSWGESWFLCGMNENGDAIFFLFSITNLGLSKMKSSLDIAYYSGGFKERWIIHKECTRKELHYDPVKHFIRLRKDSFKLEPPFIFKVKEKNIQVNITLNPLTPPYRGATFECGKKFLNVYIPSLKGEISGFTENRGERVAFKGFGYLSHSNTDFVLSNFLTSWNAARGVADDYSVELQLYGLQKKYGEGSRSFVVITKNNRILYVFKNPELKIVKKSFFHKCGCWYPEEIKITPAQHPGVEIRKITFKMKGIKFYDILAFFPWVERVVVKTFFTKPWEGRAIYDLRIETKERIIKGEAIGDMDIFK